MLLLWGLEEAAVPYSAGCCVFGNAGEPSTVNSSLVVAQGGDGGESSAYFSNTSRIWNYDGSQGFGDPFGLGGGNTFANAGDVTHLGGNGGNGGNSTYPYNSTNTSPSCWAV